MRPLREKIRGAFVQVSQGQTSLITKELLTDIERGADAINPFLRSINMYLGFFEIVKS